jgi:hypothetical protein
MGSEFERTFPRGANFLMTTVTEFLEESYFWAIWQRDILIDFRILFLLIRYLLL